MTFFVGILLVVYAACVAGIVVAIAWSLYAIVELRRGRTASPR